jgi:hypothetical protein
MEEAFIKLMALAPDEVKVPLEKIPELRGILQKMYHIGWMDCSSFLVKALEASLPDIK